MRLLAFLEDRLGVASAWHAAMSGKHPPRGIGFLRTIGFAALVVLVLQVLSGVALALHYVPTTALAYDSIRALEQDVPLGAFVRALHHYGASAFVVLAALHLMRVFFTGAYKPPRELTWLTGLGLFGVVLGFGFTGYLLPWDQKAYFATVVGTEIAGQAPVVGAAMREALVGGDEVAQPTLTRFYVIHVVLLPLALGLLLAIHLFLVQRHGVSPPGRRVGDPGEPGPAYYPHHTFKEALAGALVGACVFALAASGHAPLGALAEPSEAGFAPRPDWYFLGLFQLLKVFEGPLEVVGTFWLPSALGLGLVLLPFVDRNPERSWRRRPLATALGLAVLAGVVALTAAGFADEPENERVAPYPLGYTDSERRGYLAARRLRCTDCHTLTIAGTTYGESQYEAPPLDDVGELDEPAFDAVLVDPAAEVGTEDMPSFAHVPREERHAIWLYARRLFADRKRGN